MLRAALIFYCSLLLNCNANLFDKQPYKAIVINDTVPNASVLLEKLENEYVIIALFANQPSVNQISQQDIMSSPYTITKVKDARIDAKLSLQFDYWDGSGPYWIGFLIVNSTATKIRTVYLSKNSISIFQPVTYISNSDFSAGIPANIDIAGMLPF